MNYVLYAVGFITFMTFLYWTVKRTPSSSFNGPWVLDIYLFGEHGEKTVVFRRRYQTYGDGDYVGTRLSNKLRKKLTKKYGQGSFPGSVKVDGKSAVVMYKCELKVVNAHQYIKPIDVYKVA